MWTIVDNAAAQREGWWIGHFELRSYELFFSGPEQVMEYLAEKAEEGSEFHTRALQHVALSKLSGRAFGPSLDEEEFHF